MSVNELESSSQLTFTIDNIEDGVSVSAPAGLGTVSYSIQGSNLLVTFAASDMEKHNNSESIQITVKGEHSEVKANLNVSITNTSGDAELASLKQLAAGINSSLTDESAQIEYIYRKSGYLLSKLTASEANNLEVDFTGLVNDFSQFIETNNTINTLPNVIFQYENGLTKESTLVESAANSLNALDEGTISITAFINNLSDSSGKLPTLPTLKHNFVNGSLSAYVGNLEFGSYEGNTFVFKDQFEIIGDILRPE
ncbi:hypothetical protein FLM48_10460 [Shewanella sp. Scap07]|nr:hypothetical protein FLM48_10460 [Shewanella sp. Scap07]